MQVKSKWTLGLAAAIVGSSLLGLGAWPFLFPSTPAPEVVPDQADELAQVPMHNATFPGKEATREAIATDPQDEPEVPASPDPVVPIALDQVIVRVVTPRGEPVPKASVVLRPSWRAGFPNAGFYSFEGGPTFEAIQEAGPNAAPGVYHASVPVGRTYLAEATAKGWGFARSEDVRVGSEVTVTLHPAATFRGTVRSKADRTPLAGAQVRVFHGAAEVHVDVLTDVEGNFVFEDLNAGPGAFFVSPQDHVGSRHTKLNFEPGDVTRRDVLVEDGWTVAGQVRRMGTEAPVASAEVSGWNFEGKTVRSDVNGFYEVRGLKPLPGQIHARAPGSSISEAHYRGPTQDLDLYLKPGAAVVGRLVHPDGAPIADAVVGHHQWPATSDIPVSTEPDGTFLIDGLNPESVVRITARALGLEAVTRQVDLPSAPEPNRTGADAFDLGDIELRPAASIEGHVRWADGQPVTGGVTAAPNADVGARSPFGGRGVHIARDGSFAIQELGPGAFEVSLNGRGLPQMSESVVLEPGEQHSAIDWVLPQGTVIEGRVRDPKGRPIAAAYVSLSDEAGPRSSAIYVRTDTEGQFRFEHFLGGRYRLYVNADETTVKADSSTKPLLPVEIVEDIESETHIEVTLRAALTPVSGRVLDGQGGAVPLAYVCRDDRSGPPKNGVLADEQGRFVIMVDGQAETKLMAWATQSFDAVTERRNLTQISFHFQRDLVGDRDSPLATVLRSTDGTAQAGAEAGPEPGRIELDEPE